MTKQDDTIVHRPDQHSNDKTLVIDEMICAFNREGFLGENEIYSLEIIYTLFAKMTTYQVKIGGLSFPNFNFMNRFLLDGWHYKMAFTARIGNTDFSWYMNNIRNGDSDYAKYMREVLGI